MKMKRSQLKALIKECLTEILQEDILLQRATQGMVYETRQQVPQMMQPMSQPPPGIINPMDDRAMVSRQQQLQQQALQRRSMMMNHAQPQAPMSDLGTLAGLGAGLDQDPGGGAMMNRADTGVRNPGDYLSLAAPKPASFRPDLDTPVGGGRARAPQHAAPAYHAPSQMPSRGSYPAHSEPAGNDDLGLPSPEILKEMFTDTAQSTYLEQAAHGHTHPGHVPGVSNGQMSMAGAQDRYANIVSQHDPQDLFPGAGNWSKLAF